MSDNKDLDKEYENYLNTRNDTNAENILTKILELGYEKDFIYNNDSEFYKNIVVQLKPTALKTVTVIIYYLKEYAEYLRLNEVAETLSKLKRREIWNEVIKNDDTHQTHISNKEYKSLIKDIEMYEEYNSLYYRTLIMCLYEGIYSGDLSVIKNLRASDIEGNNITVRPDNKEPYNLEVSDDLIRNLKNLAEINYWERRNNSSEYEVVMTGDYKDSCFKITHRISGKNSFKHVYYHKIRKVTKEYLGRTITPYNLFIDGLFYRITKKIQKRNITISEAFDYYNKKSIPYVIALDEMERCNLHTPFSRLREIIAGREYFITEE